jgi:hydroxymethylbilane synthase
MATDDSLKMGTRGSLLARTQTEWVVECLTRHHPELRIDITVIRTTGDIHSQRGLPQPLSKGLFTREIENALLAGDVDLAVHSLKDLPTELATGMELGAIPEREDPRDALVGASLSRIREQPDEITLGTSSLRRAAQLKTAFPGCRVVNLQGNVDTRLRKVKEGVVGCAVMAAAGLKRLNRNEVISDFIDPETMLPAPGQGALGIEIRSGDSRVRDLLACINSTETHVCVSAERAFLHRLGGGCRAPVAALATISDNVLTIRGRVLSLDGSRVFDGTISDAPDRAEETGQQLADKLADKGAREMLEQILNETNVTTG